jgi:hypothetical protein
MGFVLDVKICVGKRKFETASMKMREKKMVETTSYYIGYAFRFEVCI